MNYAPLFDYIDKRVDFNEREKELLIAHSDFRRYLKGQYIVQQGDVCRYESFVVKGCLKSFYIDSKGTEHILMFAIENWWIADMGSLIDQIPASYNVQCLETTEVIQFTHEKMEELLTRVPKMDRLLRMILQRAFIAFEKRLVVKFSLTAKEQYVQFKSQYPQIEKRVPQYMIASYLGITREFLSRIKSELIYEQ